MSKKYLKWDKVVPSEKKNEPPRTGAEWADVNPTQHPIDAVPGRQPRTRDHMADWSLRNGQAKGK